MKRKEKKPLKPEENSSQSSSNPAPTSIEPVDDVGRNMDSLKIEGPQESDLDMFREQWKQELERKNPFVSQTSSSQHEADEEKARSLFLEGVEHEKRGDMAEAVKQYTKAVKLVPDIERKVYPPTSTKQNRARSTSRVRRKDSSTEHIHATALEENLSQRIAERGSIFVAASELQPCYLQQMPYEILHLLVRYVTGSQLNCRHLDTLSEVCGEFYLLARSEELWKKILCRSVGDSTAQQASELYPQLSWREMFLKTPHVLYDGVYLSKITYIRYGEAGFQDQNFKPWHTVTYYRLIRFYPNGQLLMTTSSDSPQVAVSTLKRGHIQKTDNGILSGSWTLDNNEICAQVKRETHAVPLIKKIKRESTFPYGVYSHSFSLRLRIVSGKIPGRFGLTWLENKGTVTYFDGNQSHFDLEVDKDSQQFPPMRFYRVRSYGESSDDCLV